MAYNKLVKLINKFAALSDEQYKDIFRNPNALRYLDDNDKLDEFYKSMPETPKDDIYNRIEWIKEKDEEVSNPKLSEYVSSFINANNEKQFPNILISQVKKGLLDNEAYSDDDIRRLSKYLDSVTVGWFADKYTRSSFYSEEYLDKFIGLYNEYISLFDRENSEEVENTKGLLLSRLSGMVDIMLGSILSYSTATDRMLYNLKEALKIRESDDFDFMEEKLNEFTNPEISEIRYRPSPGMKASPVRTVDREEATAVG